MRGELTKKRESTFPPSGFWVGGLGEEGWAYDAFGWGKEQGGESYLESRRHSEGLGGSKGRSKKPQRFRERSET